MESLTSVDLDSMESLTSGDGVSMGTPTSGDGNMGTQTSRDGVSFHWFYQEAQGPWNPFSLVDSVAIESVYGGTGDRIIKTHGTRFDVDIRNGTMAPVYWEGPIQYIRRCSWFHRSVADGPWEPYSEDLAALLEQEYTSVAAAGLWHRRVSLNDGEWVLLHSPVIMRHFKGGSPGVLATAFSDQTWAEKGPPPSADLWEMKRGIGEMEIPEGESPDLDHLVFVVHGIGSICDSKFRNIVEVVDLFRQMTDQLLEKHFESVYGSKKINRVEFLPVNWHNKLHQEDNGTDAKIAPLTLPSLPMLRSFTNSTILDVLYYTTPVHCQIIQDTTATEINRLYKLFRERNPGFTGEVSFIGHSLGSIILFDLLCGQRQEAKHETETGPLVPLVKFPILDVQPTHFFALGSPIAMFLSTRGVDTLGNNFSFPTCPKFYNIFHPYDPIAYRLEPLLHPDLANHSPALVPHHKGRKRLHLELTDLSKKVFTGIKAMFYMAGATWNHDATVDAVEDDTEQQTVKVDVDKIDAKINCGSRVDFSLQETPFESINEYLFALSSHLAYWQSKDTSLFVLKEVYAQNGLYSP